jgi:hypothetical protein
MDIQTISRTEEIYRKMSAPRSAESHTNISSEDPKKRFNLKAQDQASQRRRTAVPSLPARTDDQKSIAERRLALVKSNNELAVTSDTLDLDYVFNIDKTFLQFNLDTDVLRDQYAISKISLERREQIIGRYKNVQASELSPESRFTVYV